MRGPHYQPWRKGPAQIIPFPKVLVRCWLVVNVSPGLWYAEIVGEPVDWEWKPVTGTQMQVTEEIYRHRPFDPRRGYQARGIPIIVERAQPEAALAAGGAA